MTQAAVSGMAHNDGATRNAFTFWVGDSLIAISLENVLSVEQDCNSIQPDPFQGRGSLGIVKHRGVPGEAVAVGAVNEQAALQSVPGRIIRALQKL